MVRRVLHVGLAALVCACAAGALANGEDPSGDGGDEGPGSGPSSCDTVPAGCRTECLLAENACAGGADSISCRMRRTSLDLCELTPPPGPFDGSGIRPNPCAGVSCGDNASCSGGECECDDGYDDPNGDGDCTAECPEDLNAAMDDVAKASLGKIPPEPWEQTESYSCSGGAVVAGHRRSNGSKYVEKTEDEWWIKRQKEDKDLCKIRASFALGAGHSHPHFEWPRDDRVRCLDTILDSSSSHFGRGAVNWA